MQPEISRPWKQDVVVGKFLKRYKRFFADVEVDGKIVVAHCANTGSLKGVIETAQMAMLTKADNPERKLQFSLQALSAPDGSWIGVNTSLPNQLVADAFERGDIPEWNDFVDYQSEVKIDAATRLDACLIDSEGRRRFIEVKNVSMKLNNRAQFPDAVTERGLKHLNEMISLVQQGHQAECVFVVQRTDCDTFSAAAGIDIEYAKKMFEARDKGVLFRAHSVEITESGLKWSPTAMKINYDLE